MMITGVPESLVDFMGSLDSGDLEAVGKSRLANAFAGDAWDPRAAADTAWRTAAIGVLMAIWWATEAVPIAVTALLPLVVFPLFSVANIQDTSAPYANKVIYLFLGGFIVAFAIQRWNLHRRIALNVLQIAGGNGKSLVGGFMLASALISMWVMNTSTTMMLLPIAVSIITVIHKTVTTLDQNQREHFQYSLLLGVAYGATIGGIATLVGTAPNAILAGFMSDNYGTQIDFARWMIVGLPLSAVMLPLAWLALTRWVFHVDFKTSPEARAELRDMKDELGSMSVPEKRVGIVFLSMAMLWITRPLLARITGIDALGDSGADSSIAMAGAIALFLIPSGDKQDPLLLRWQYAERLPWSVIILFGGGLTLASAVYNTGLALWIGTSLEAVGTLPVAVVVVIAVTMIIFSYRADKQYCDDNDLSSRCRIDRRGRWLRSYRANGPDHAGGQLCIHVASGDAAERDRVWIRVADNSQDGASRACVKPAWYRFCFTRRRLRGAENFLRSAYDRDRRLRGQQAKQSPPASRKSGLR